MLSLHNLSLENYNEKIFESISFTLLPGSIYLLKGPNGSGKTSLLKTISGIIKPSSGELLWNNKKINKAFYQHNFIAYLGHKLALEMEFTVLENLSFWAKLKDTELLIQPALAHFKLEKYINHKINELSSGWQKKVALARLIVSNSNLWLLDEPENNLDNSAIELLLQLLQVKISSGGIAIIASHSQDLYTKLPIINLSDFKQNHEK